MYIREIIYSQARKGSYVYAHLYMYIYICDKDDRHMIYRARNTNNVDIAQF